MQSNRNASTSSICKAENPDAALLWELPNDDTANWCVPPVDGNLHSHTDPNGSTWQLVATPGKENDCPFFDWPTVGEAAFVEIMTAPQETSEWFELHNATDRDLEVTLCELRREKSPERNICIPDAFCCKARPASISGQRP